MSSPVMGSLPVPQVCDVNEGLEKGPPGQLVPNQGDCRVPFPVHRNTGQKKTCDT